MEGVKVYNYFPGGNTPEGFYSYYQYLSLPAKRVYIIKGGPGTGKSTFMKKTGEELKERGYSLEYHWCSSDSCSLDGLVVPGLDIALFDGTAPHMYDPVYPGAVEEIINLGLFWSSHYLRKHQQDIIDLSNQTQNRFQQAYRYLKAAAEVYKNWKDYYTNNLDFQQTERKIYTVLSEIPLKKKANKASARHLFASALTPQGPVDFYQSLTNKLKNVYYIKGQPGTGKSTLIEFIGRELYNSGYHILYLHRPLEPKKAEGIIIPEIETAIITNSPPFQITPGPDDRVIDMMECLNFSDQNKKENSNREISEMVDIFDGLIFQAIQNLKYAKEKHDKLEEYYISCMDYEAIEKMRKDFFKSIECIYPE